MGTEMRFLKSKGDVKYDHTNRILVRKKKKLLSSTSEADISVL